MPDSRYPIEVVRGVPVVAAPAAIDLGNAHRLRATLMHLAASGHATFVVDMTVTQACDPAGLAELMRSYKHAAAEGGDLRLVVCTHAASRIVAHSGLRRLVRQFPSVADAVAETPAVRIMPRRPVRWAPASGRADARAGRVPLAAR